MIIYKYFRTTVWVLDKHNWFFLYSIQNKLKYMTTCVMVPWTGVSEVADLFIWNQPVAWHKRPRELWILQ